MFSVLLKLIFCTLVMSYMFRRNRAPSVPPGPVTVKLPTIPGTVPILRLVISLFFYLLRSGWFCERIATDADVNRAVTSWLQALDRFLPHWHTSVGAKIGGKWLMSTLFFNFLSVSTK
jgi:hypothetical protein